MQLLSDKQEHRSGSEKSLEDEAQESEPLQAVIEPEVGEAQIEASAEILKKSLASTPPPSPAAGKVEEGMEKGKKYFNCQILTFVPFTAWIFAIFDVKSNPNGVHFLSLKICYQKFFQKY